MANNEENPAAIAAAAEADSLPVAAEEEEAQPAATPYRVQIPPLFEGPLDLLLYLVEREKLDITAISLTLITNQYLEHLQLLLELDKTQSLPLDPAPVADFVAMAARLLWIKSRALLPRPEPLSPQEEEDPGEALARQLREYKMFKEAARALAQRGETMHCYVRIAPPPSLPPRLETLDLTMESLLKALQRALVVENVPLPTTPLAPLRVTLSEKMELIRHLLAEGQPLRFHDLLTRAMSRLEIVVSFMAVLELLKRKVINAQQEQMFGEILIVPAAVAATA